MRLGTLAACALLLGAGTETQALTWSITTILDDKGSDSTPPSLAFDPSGKPVIAYSSGHLRIASWESTGWTTRAVASDPAKASTNPSLAFDQAGNPGIASGWTSGDNEVTYSDFDGQDWTTETVYSGLVGSDPSLAFDANGDPAIAGKWWQDVRCSVYDGADWVHMPIGTYPEVGSSTSLVYLSNGEPGIALAGADAGLKFATNPRQNPITLKWSWDLADVDSSPSAYASIVIKPDGNPAIAYWDSMNKDLKYAYYTGSQWNTVTVESQGNVGIWASLALDADGLPGISYIDKTNSALKYAHYDGSAWRSSVVDQIFVDYYGSVRGAASLAFSPEGSPSIAYTTDGFDLRYAVIPEPSTPLLLACGLAGLAWSRRRSLQ